MIEEQRRRRRAQENAAKPVLAVPPPRAAAQSDHKLKHLVGSAVNMVMQQFPALDNTGVPAAATHAQALVQTPARVSASGKRRRNPLFCNQYNTAAGCAAPKQTGKGCEWPDGSRFRHGCSWVKPDGKYCNAREHTVLTCPKKV